MYFIIIVEIFQVGQLSSTPSRVLYALVSLNKNNTDMKAVSRVFEIQLSALETWAGALRLFLTSPSYFWKSDRHLDYSYDLLPMVTFNFQVDKWESQSNVWFWRFSGCRGLYTHPLTANLPPATSKVPLNESWIFFPVMHSRTRLLILGCRKRFETIFTPNNTCYFDIYPQVKLVCVVSGYEN